jgi:hypothetical protein
MDIVARAGFRLLVVLALGCALQAQSTSKAPSQPATSAPDRGAIVDGVYHNPAYGFTYKIHFGWVDRTREMSEEPSEEPSADSPDSKKSILLLAVFEHPPEAIGDTVNSAVVVAAEPASSYPGLHSAEQYFGPLTGLTKSKGLTVVNEPYEFRVGATQLVRGDFSKALGNLSMHQSTLVLLEKGYVVSFTFIGGDEDEVAELVEGLSFGQKQAPPPHK